jgi:hypothetical protein
VALLMMGKKRNEYTKLKVEVVEKKCFIAVVAFLLALGKGII